MRHLTKIVLCTLILCTGVFTQGTKKTGSVRPAGATPYVATAYCLSGKMANGQRVHRGSIAASKLLPIGSRLYIYDLGLFTVKDRGGDIKGKRLDLWMPSCHEARRFGRRTVYVNIV